MLRKRPYYRKDDSQDRVLDQLLENKRHIRIFCMFLLN